MTEFTQFEKTEQVSTAPVESKTYDKWWLRNLTIAAPDPLKPVKLTAAWVPARDITIQTEQGQGVVTSIDVFNETVVITFDDEISETFSLDYVMERIHHCEHGCSPAPAHIESLKEESE